MRLLAPLGLALAGLLAPLVLLYVLKVQRVRRRVPSVWLWMEAQRELSARSPWKRLVPQIPLFLQALALAALALAAARPATSGRRVDGDHVAIVVDTSASMGASSGGVTRLDEAKRAAHELVDALAPGSDAILLDAGREPTVAMPTDRDRRRMHAAIDALAVREVEGDLEASLALAVQRLGQAGGTRRAVVITDGALARAVSFHTAVPVEVVRVGTPVDNVAIVRVDVRSGEDPLRDREEVQAFLVVANFGRAAREVFVTMKQRGASDTLASRKVVVGPGERLPVVLTFAPTPGDRGSGLVFELSPRDALEVDDVAYARVPPGRRLEVVLAAAREPSPWLERVLAADPDAEVRSGTLPAALAGVGDESFVVVEGACPAELPGQDVWIVDPPEGECFGAKVGEAVVRPELTSWEETDPRMRFLSLADVFVAKARALTPASKRQSLLRSATATLACDASTASRHVTLLGFDVAETDWPYKASFVVFARNLLDLARQHRSSTGSGSASTGSALRLPVPLGVREAAVLVPGEPEREPARVGARDGVVVVPEASRAGFYLASWQAPTAGSVLVPVNLASSAESDLGRSVESASGAARVVSTSEAAAAPREHATWLALVALGFVLVDVWYFTRRPRIAASVAEPVR